MRTMKSGTRPTVRRKSMWSSNEFFAHKKNVSEEVKLRNKITTIDRSYGLAKDTMKHNLFGIKNSLKNIRKSTGHSIEGLPPTPFQSHTSLDAAGLFQEIPHFRKSQTHDHKKQDDYLPPELQYLENDNDNHESLDDNELFDLKISDVVDDRATQKENTVFLDDEIFIENKGTSSPVDSIKRVNQDNHFLLVDRGKREHRFGNASNDKNQLFQKNNQQESTKRCENTNNTLIEIENQAADNLEKNCRIPSSHFKSEENVCLADLRIINMSRRNSDVNDAPYHTKSSPNLFLPKIITSPDNTLSNGLQTRIKKLSSPNPHDNTPNPPPRQHTIGSFPETPYGLQLKPNSNVPLSLNNPLLEQVSAARPNSKLDQLEGLKIDQPLPAFEASNRKRVNNVDKHVSDKGHHTYTYVKTTVSTSVSSPKALLPKRQVNAQNKNKGENQSALRDIRARCRTCQERFRQNAEFQRLKKEKEEREAQEFLEKHNEHLAGKRFLAGGEHLKLFIDDLDSVFSDEVLDFDDQRNLRPQKTYRKSMRSQMTGYSRKRLDELAQPRVGRCRKKMQFSKHLIRKEADILIESHSHPEMTEREKERLRLLESKVRMFLALVQNSLMPSKMVHIPQREDIMKVDISHH